MKIGILNAGNIGRTLAKPWYDAGHELMLTKQGNQEKLDKFMLEVARANRGCNCCLKIWENLGIWAGY